MNLPEPAYPEKSIGDILKEARESRGISIEALSTETKLNIEIIISLENNTFGDLPALPYVRAFLVTLCKRLGLNADDMIKILTSQMGVPKEDSIPVDIKKNLNSSKNSGNFIPLLVLVAIGVVLLVMLMKLQKKSTVVEGPVESPVIKDTLPGLTEMQTTNQDSTDSTDAQDSLGGGADTSVEKTVVDIPDKKPEIPAYSPANTTQGSSNFITFNCIKDSVWINVKRNGKREVNKKMNKGGSWTVSVSDTMMITSGVKGSVEFNLNGKSYTPKLNKFNIIDGKFEGP